MSVRLAIVWVALGACSSTRTRVPESLEPPAEAPDTGAAEHDPGLPPAPPGCAAAEPKGPAPWYADAVFYEVFVRSFQDSNGDGIGDLPGLTSRLDYLNDGDPATTSDLGVTALWLMPIHPSPSYHGYDVTDYRAVNPEYGTLADFDALVAAAEKRGIRVILDLVANHTSNLHPWFQKAKRSPEAQSRGWYVWRDDAPPWGRPWDKAGTVWHPAKQAFYYGLFSPDMPDLNYESADVRAELLGVADFWLARGASGFRIDGARYLVETGPGEGQADTPGTHAFWRELRAHVTASKPQAVLVGEVWTDLAKTATYVSPEELALVFGFDRRTGLRDALRLGLAAPLAGRVCDELATLPNGGLGSFTENHDLDRLATEIAGDPAALRLAAVLLMTLPGTPFLYYGQELGLANGAAAGDQAKRMPMPWDESTREASGGSAAPVSTQTADAGSLLSLYRRLVRLRQSMPSLAHGGTSRVTVKSAGDAVFAYLRVAGDSRVLVVANLGRTPATSVDLDLTSLPEPLGATSHLGPLLPARTGGHAVLPSLEARKAMVVELSPVE